MSEKVGSLRDRESALKKAGEHFQPVLKEYFGEPAFVLTQENPTIVSGARVTAILLLSRFVDMFGDLVNKEDYNIESFKKRNKEGDFGIEESVFDEWKKAGCLI